MRYAATVPAAGEVGVLVDVVVVPSEPETMAGPTMVAAVNEARSRPVRACPYKGRARRYMRGLRCRRGRHAGAAAPSLRGATSLYATRVTPRIGQACEGMWPTIDPCDRSAS